RLEPYCRVAQAALAHPSHTDPVHVTRRDTPPRRRYQTPTASSSSTAVGTKSSVSWYTCRTSPLPGSSRSSTPLLPTSHMEPSAAGAIAVTSTLPSEAGSSSLRSSTENCRQSGGRYHRPASVLASHRPPSRSWCAADHSGLTAPWRRSL